MSDSGTPYTAAHQAPLSLGFSRQEYWSGLPFPSPLSTRCQLQQPSKSRQSKNISRLKEPTGEQVSLNGSNFCILLRTFLKLSNYCYTLLSSKASILISHQTYYSCCVFWPGDPYPSPPGSSLHRDWHLLQGFSHQTRFPHAFWEEQLYNLHTSFSLNYVPSFSGVPKIVFFTFLNPNSLFH